MNEFLFACIVCIAVYVIVLSARKSDEKIKEDIKKLNSQKAKVNNIINNIKDFKVSKSILSNDSTQALAIDETLTKIYILKSAWSTTNNKVYSYKDILSVEIIENGNTITKTNRGSQIGGVLVGAVLLGGAGAVIGGLSGTKREVKTIESIGLKILLNNQKSSIFELTLYKIGKDTAKPQVALSTAHRWHDLITVLINKADKDDDNLVISNTLNQEKHQNIVSVADEIQKLLSLRNDKIITEEEFSTQKKKLLNS